MENNKKYWLWLSIQCRTDSARIKRVLGRFRTPENVYNATSDELAQVYGIGTRDAIALADKSLEKTEKIMADMQAAGVEIVTYNDYNYPHKLRNIEKPPYVLYMKGEIDWHNIKPITIVGTRKCTEYGIEVTRSISASLTELGFTVISGMASGIDAAAAWAALEAGGKTVAVLGSRIDVIYPSENADLYEEITKNGIVVSEFMPGTNPLPGNFPHRNRIMSALGDGVLVAEAPIGSGALITARKAIDAGKSVFAVPGPIFKNAYAGSNRLIQQGAKMVTSARDIAEEYIFDRRVISMIPRERHDSTPLTREEYMDIEVPELSSVQEEEKEKYISADDERFAALDDDERKIIELLIEREYGADEMCRKLDMKINVLGNVLIGLEMQGLITKLAGNSYKING